MKRLMIAVLLGLAMAAGVRAEEAGATNRIGLVNVGGFDEPLFSRIAGHLAKYLHTTPKALAPRELAGGTNLTAEAAALAPLVTGDVILVIGVVAAPAEIAAHGAVLPQEKVAVVNATALKPETYDEEAYGRRLEKEAIHCAGLLMGMSPCPNPRCALFQYETVEQLDRKGRNFCPPCQAKFEKLQIEHHLDRRAPEGTP